MRIILLPLVFSIGYMGYEYRDKILDQYHAAYPVDSAKEQALAECAQDPKFNRLDTDDRHDCYAAHLVRGASNFVGTRSPYYGNQGQASGNDVRREQANEAYIAAHGADAIPVIASAPQPTPHPAAPTHHVTTNTHPQQRTNQYNQ
jgi:hypothetical protein